LLASGRFGVCYLCTFSRYQTCIKVPKQSKRNSNLISEPNIISRFLHSSLPNLFGVCMKENSIIMRYHGFENQTLTIYDILHSDSKTSTTQVMIEGINIFKQIVEGCDHIDAKFFIMILNLIILF